MNQMNRKNPHNSSEQDWEALRASLSLPSADGAWNDMQSRLDQHLPEPVTPPEEKKRRRLLWLLLMVVFLIGWLLFSTGNKEHSKNVSTSNRNASPEQRVEPDNGSVQGNKLASSSEKPIPATDSGTSHSSSLQAPFTPVQTDATENNELHKPDKHTANNQRDDNNLSVPKAVKPVKGSSSVKNPNKYQKEKDHKKGRWSPRNNSNHQKMIPTGKDPIAAMKADRSGDVANRVSGPATDSSGTGSANALKENPTSVASAKKPDSVSKPANVDKTGEEHKELILTAGIQWNLQLPSSGPSQYFTGPDLSFQPYRNLIPGAWIRVQVERSAVVADVSPLYSTLVAEKTHYTFFESVSTGDTIVNTTEQRSMRKNFGLGAGIGYEYQLLPQWWIGVGFHSYWWSKAIGKAKGMEEKIPINGSGKIIRNYERNYIIPSDEFQYFRKSQQNLSFTALYTSNRWQGGLRAGFTFSSLAKRDGPRNLTRMDFLFRLPLIGARRK